MMTDRASSTKRPPTIARRISCLLMTATAAIAPPSGSDPTTVATMVSMVHGARDAYSIVLNQASRFLEWTATEPELAMQIEKALR